MARRGEVPLIIGERPPQVDVLGVPLTATDLPGAAEVIRRWIITGDRQYVCVRDVHGVVECQRDPDLMAIHQQSGMNTTDGMPLVWCVRRAGVPDAQRVYGPDLMLTLAERAVAEGWRSYFYGAGPGVADELAARLERRFPGFKTVGTFSPPYRPLTPAEDDAIVAAINEAAPDIVWVGLSTPKQEHWMAEHRDRLDAPVLIGVGAAFDIHSGRVRQAPALLQRTGTEWLFRLLIEPRRLWRRYVQVVPRFVWQLARNRPHLIDRGEG